MLSFPIAPRHKLEAAYRAGQPQKTRLNETWGVNTPIGELVGSGAWLIESYKPEERIVYKRNPNYWQKDPQGRPLPYLERRVTLIVPDINTTTLKFRARETDVLSVQPTDYPQIKRDEKQGNYAVQNLGSGWGFSYLGFNMNPEAKVAPWKIKLFSDVRFRRAVSHSIDRERMAKDLFRGLAKPLYTPVSPANIPFFNPKAPSYPYDLEKARALLQEIGLKDSDGNGLLEYEGKEVKFNIITNVENNLRKAQATIISNDLKKVGLNASFTPIQFNKIITLLNNKPYQWEAIVLGFTGGPEPHGGSNIWRSTGLSHQWRPKQKTPATPWEAEIDELFRKGAQELTRSSAKPSTTAGRSSRASSCPSSTPPCWTAWSPRATASAT